jgi:hypothetical protein
LPYTALVRLVFIVWRRPRAPRGPGTPPARRQSSTSCDVKTKVHHSSHHVSEQSQASRSSAPLSSYFCIFFDHSMIQTFIPAYLLYISIFSCQCAKHSILKVRARVLDVRKTTDLPDIPLNSSDRERVCSRPRTHPTHHTFHSPLELHIDSHPVLCIRKTERNSHHLEHHIHTNTMHTLQRTFESRDAWSNSSAARRLSADSALRAAAIPTRLLASPRRRAVCPSRSPLAGSAATRRRLRSARSVAVRGFTLERNRWECRHHQCRHRGCQCRGS